MNFRMPVCIRAGGNFLGYVVENQCCIAFFYLLWSVWLMWKSKQFYLIPCVDCLSLYLRSVNLKAFSGFTKSANITKNPPTDVFIVNCIVHCHIQHQTNQSDFLNVHPLIWAFYLKTTCNAHMASTLSLDMNLCPSRRSNHHGCM